MSAVGRKLRRMEGDLIAFHCPGCDEFHHVRLKTDGPRGWTWNGSGDAPTFSPSVLVTGSARFLSEEEHTRVMQGEKVDLPQMRCHSFVTDGRIQFLGDCTHALAGQTVDLPDWPAAYGDQ